MNAIFDWVIALSWNGPLALWLYWAPLVMCACGYTVRTWHRYRDDVSRRAAEEKDTHMYYSPRETIGTILGRVLASVTPVVNLLAGIFDIGPEVFAGFFNWIGRVFNQPLVPKRKVKP